MFKRMIAAALAVASVFTATSAMAESYRCNADSTPATTVLPGHKLPGTGTCDCPSGKPAVGQQCPAYVAKMRQTPMPQQSDSRANPRQIQPGSQTPPVVLNQGDLDELRRQYELDKAAQRPVSPVAAPAPRAAAPVASAACWTRHSVELAQMSALLHAGKNDANWQANICQSPEDFAVNFSRMTNYGRPTSVSDFLNTFNTFTEIDCRDDLVKNLVFVSSTGQKGAPFGKCGDDDKLWINPSNQVVWSKTKGGGSVVAAKDAIFAK